MRTASKQMLWPSQIHASMTRGVGVPTAREQAATSGRKGRELSKHLRWLLTAAGKQRAQQCVLCTICARRVLALSRRNQ